ncbi:unnamed protein product [Clonostachys rosea f. rosea IK726]|uniref:Uncharacterized protein n=2 Tax=Bionectria ochroleuca TaxID=29856 RepID=A0A0B7JY57_BIOOC|nr:unnamed protein product [Clonostachys rosea f. rosea IK726]
MRQRGDTHSKARYSLSTDMVLVNGYLAIVEDSRQAVLLTDPTEGGKPRMRSPGLSVWFRCAGG